MFVLIKLDIRVLMKTVNVLRFERLLLCLTCQDTSYFLMSRTRKFFRKFPFPCVILDMFVLIKLDIRVPMKTVNVYRSEGLFLWLARATTLTWTKRNRRGFSDKQLMIHPLIWHLI